MSEADAINGPEKRGLLEDSARKFTLNSLGSEFLKEIEDHSFLLTTDWLEVGEDKEKKLACKKYKSGKVEYLLIEKFTDENGNRAAPPKKKLTKERYEELLTSSILCVKKVRYEFKVVQNDITLDLKYDEFLDSDLRVLEVDAGTEQERNAFNPSEFPTQLMEVTGDLRYYGYRVADMV